MYVPLWRTLCHTFLGLSLEIEITRGNVPGKTSSSPCTSMEIVSCRTVTTKWWRGDVCSPSVTVKLKPPDSDPDGRSMKDSVGKHECYNLNEADI